MPLKLTRMTLLLQAVAWLGIALLILLPTVNWIGPWLTGGGGAEARRAVASGDRVLAWLMVIPPYAVVALGLYQVTRFCRTVRHSQVFTVAAVTALRRFGWSLIAGSLLFPVSRLAVVLYINGGTWPAVTAQAGAAVGLQFLLYVAIGVMFGLVLVVFATILGEASRLAEENASFV